MSVTPVRFVLEVLRRIKASFRPARRDGDLREELQSHLDLAAEEAARALRTGTDSARQIRLRAGGMAQALEAMRDQRGVAWIDIISQDARCAWRRLWHERGYAIVAVTTLALAVGANTAVLSVADAVLFRPLPYADPDAVHLIEIRNRESGVQSTMTPFSFVRAIDAIEHTVSDVGMTLSGPPVSIETADGPETVGTLSVNPGYFHLLGVTLARGRLFDQRDRGHDGRRALLSYAAWQQRFGADERIVGSTTVIGDATFDIIGVLPRGFVFPSRFAGKPEIVTEAPPLSPGALGGTFHSIVRLGQGVSREQAEAAMASAVATAAAADPNWRDATAVLADIRTTLYGRAAVPIMRYLLAAATLTLLIAGANLSNLLIVRGQRRAPDIALRRALGAGRARLVWPILIEAVTVGLASAVVAVGATSLLFDVLLRQVPPVAYGSAPVGVTWRVVSISLAMSVVSAVLFAVLPAWRVSRLDAMRVLQSRRGRSAWQGLRWPLVAAQVALSVLAVFGAVVAGRAFVSILNVPLGFSTDRVVRIGITRPPRVIEQTARVVSVSPGKIEVADPPPPTDVNFHARIVEQLRTHHSVISVGATARLPLDTQAPYTRANLPGADERAGIGVDYVLPGVFETLGIPVLRGRSLTWEDWRTDPGATVLGESAARALFGERDPIGERLVEARSRRALNIVGVVADPTQSLERVNQPRAYALQAGGRGVMSVVALAGSQDDRVLAELKQAVRAAAPSARVSATWWNDSIADMTSYRNPRFQTIVLGTLSLLALTLTALGIFGVVNHLVVTRTREIAVRVALGATPAALVRKVLGEAATPVTVGLVVGLGASRLFAPLAEAQLFKADTHDPLTLGAAGAVVVTAALAAAYLPARRAAAVDPAVALRNE